MSLVQVHAEHGFVNRVPPNVKPVAELHLEPHQRIISFEMHEFGFGRAYAERKTRDYAWTAIIETRL